MGPLPTARLFPSILPLNIPPGTSTRLLASPVHCSTVGPRTHSPQQLPSIMLSKTTTLHQHDILGGPRSAVVHHYSLGALAELEADFRTSIPSSPPSAVGVSIELAPVGPRIQTLVLATQDKVFCLALQQSPSPTQCKALRELFSIIPYLAGFEFSYTIVLLAHTLGSHVIGYDLSTLAMVSKQRDLTTPGGFLNSKNPFVSARNINDRWDGDVLRSGANSSGIPQPNHALRAWFTAMCVTLSYPHWILINLHQ